MSSPYIGEVRMVGFNYTPANWLACDGSLYNISDYDALYALIGTTYGGNGQTTFAVPDFRSKVPIHVGKGSDSISYTLGQQVGQETVTLNTNQMGPHTHAFQASSAVANSPGPSGAYPASQLTTPFYSVDNNPANLTPLSPNSTTSAGGSQPHNNVAPYLCINYIICAFGIYPPQN